METLKPSAIWAMVLVASLAQGAAAAEAVFYYEPQKVELSGTLVEKTFDGPPSYGEDPEHDVKEQAYIIQLEKPITVVPSQGDTTNERHDNVGEMQIVNMKHLPLATLLKQRVVVKGTLFSAITGHHHTDVLINAEDVSPDRGSSSTPVDSPERVVSSLYSDFPPDGDQDVTWQKKEVLAKYFDSNLVDLFLKDQECSEKEKGICNIDFMILFAAQDYQITEFHVGAFDPARKEVRVQFKNFGKPVVLVYRISETPVGWRVSDILYQKGHSLVEILRQ